MATQAIAAQGIFDGGRQQTITPEERELALRAAQQRARRGPTPEVLFTKRLDNSRLVKAADPVRVREMRSFASVMALLLVMVLVYGWQHFSSIEYGYRVESEKQQLLSLEEQNRQLRLSEAELGDPVRIDRIARQLGLEAPRPGQVVRPDASVDPSTPVLAEATPILPSMR
ncbi:cell division protein FtsL [Acidipila rosea]|uniref:Cell division protein FtsL n=1 Tax=Acidipila rosea TaxID=768535 RepID=A0A4R1L801_9BACT|nr:cell division protein FtsL [Acidipila rosea]MBW4027131.1 cell division protein FtsL [Acidobacteriota bacterium]MBW4045710.1 cell division protein FtsL [Acidobacteriota bacterium]TCK74364.1 cell division protein FtsL [Acidipila rosea]